MSEQGDCLSNINRAELIKMIRENMDRDLRSFDEKAIIASIESNIIEGFCPTQESIQDILNLLNGSITIEELAEKHRYNSQKGR